MTATAAAMLPHRRPLRSLAVAAGPYLYCAPALILIATVMLVPLAVGLSCAFRDIELLNPMSGDHVGLDHFRDMAADENFWNALRNPVWWTVASVALQFVFGLILALVLNRPFPGREIVQALVFLPWAVPAFLSGLDWAWLFNPVVGPLPPWLFVAGILATPDSILSNPDLVLWGPISANVWWGTPFFAITLLAALQSIPRDLYEATAIDGAGPLRRFRDVTLPAHRPRRQAGAYRRQQRSERADRGKGRSGRTDGRDNAAPRQLHRRGPEDPLARSPKSVSRRTNPAHAAR